MASSACGVNVSVSVALLLVRSGSVTPPGAATVAVFATLPVALMLPVPLAVNPDAPPLPTAVNVSLVIAAGRVSLTVAPVTALGPLLATTMVYVVDVPGTALDTPSVLVMLRSAIVSTVSVSVALLLPGVGSVAPAGTVTVAVLTRLPPALAAMLAGT